MFTYLINDISSGCETVVEDKSQRSSLTVWVDKLADLRFSIILTARFASSPEQDPERREQLRARLVRLRRQYLDKIDEIAMQFGVQEAMDAKADIEGRVVLPREIGMSESLRQEQFDAEI